MRAFQNATDRLDWASRRQDIKRYGSMIIVQFESAALAWLELMIFWFAWHTQFYLITNFLVHWEKDSLVCHRFTDSLGSIWTKLGKDLSIRSEAFEFGSRICPWTKRGVKLTAQLIHSAAEHEHEPFSNTLSLHLHALSVKALHIHI